jgi:hypothetical protein
MEIRRIKEKIITEKAIIANVVFIGNFFLLVRVIVNPIIEIITKIRGWMRLLRIGCILFPDDGVLPNGKS